MYDFDMSHLFEISVSLDGYPDDSRGLCDVELWPCEGDERPLDVHDIPGHHIGLAVHQVKGEVVIQNRHVLGEDVADQAIVDVL